MTIERLIIFVTAFSFLLYGLLFALAPAPMTALVLDFRPTGVSTLIDIRSTYGGTNMAVGLFMLYLYWVRQTRACLVFIILVLISMAITRTAGFIIDGHGNLFMNVMLALELTGSALALYTLSKQNHVT